MSDEIYKSDNPKKEVMIKALQLTLGVISPACRKAGISRQTHYDWLENDPEYEAAANEAKELAVDLSESKLLELINGVKMKVKNQKGEDEVIYTQRPDTTAIIFHLKTQGKDRGYVEKQEFDHGFTGGDIIIPTVDGGSESPMVIDGGDDEKD